MSARTGSPASLEVAARFTRDTTLASWVVVQRQPSVVAQAQSVAKRLGLDVLVEIDAATIALRFVVPALRPVQPTERVSGKRRSLLREGWARLARRSVPK